MDTLQATRACAISLRGIFTDIENVPVLRYDYLRSNWIHDALAPPVREIFYGTISRCNTSMHYRTGHEIFVVAYLVFVIFNRWFVCRVNVINRYLLRRDIICSNSVRRK